MENKDLFELRVNGSKEFTNIGDLTKFTERLFDEDFSFPMVVGYMDSVFKKENWQDYVKTWAWHINQVNPSEKIDVLTVQNYIEGLKRIKQKEPKLLSSKPFQRGILFYEGIDSRHYSNNDTNIFHVHLPLELSNFSLSLFWNDEKGYQAISQVIKNPLEIFASNFVGPRTEYHRTMA